MKLRDIKIEAAGAKGWYSNQLVFGSRITQLFGPNGCGKTPIIQSIAYALGYPVKFREDIYDHCDAAVLRLETDVGEVELRRKIDKSRFDIEVRLENEDGQRFYSEKDYSKYLFDLFGLATSTLTSTGNEPVEPYMATFLPVFYLDQDNGYTSLYKAPATFIKEQYTEMMRLAFGVPPKHSYDQKKLVIEKKKRLDQVDHLIVRKQELIESLSSELNATKRTGYQLDQEIADIKNRLEELKKSRSLKSDADAAINSLIYERQSAYKKLEKEIVELKTRVDGFEKIRNEIEIEINTLSLNEEARRVFSTFDDICANKNCGLFLGSSESYGKNLLYLKDQVKDLQRNSVAQKIRMEVLHTQAVAMKKEIGALENKRNEIAAGEGTDGIIEAIGELTRRIIDLQKEKQTVDELEEQENDYVQLLNERERVQNDLASLGGTASSSDLRVIEIRSELRERIKYWLDVLRTRNVSREIAVDNDFGVLFGEEKISQLKGSTLLRVILAVHTAFFELYTNDFVNKFRFLILDTPRQQDIEAADLANYIAELKKLAVANEAQIIFSTTEYHYECGRDDREWVPEFPGLEQNMFLSSQ